jgi:outer membrane lipoprotein SlyB
MKMTRPLVLAALAIGGLAVGGCASSRSSLPVYNPSQVGTVMSTRKGQIVAVRDVIIKAPPPSNASIGSVIGGGVGRSATTGNPGAIGGAVGSVIGANVGARADEKRGEELTIAVEGGYTVVIVQEQGDAPFAPGEKVQIITGGGLGGSYPGGVMGRGTGIGMGMGLPGGGLMGGNTRVVHEVQFAATAQQ